MAISFTKYTAGDGMRSVCEVRNPQTKTLFDPDDIVMRLKDPAGTETAVTPTRLDTGIYEASAVLDKSGVWYRQWKVSGSVEAVDEATILVEKSNFTV